MASNSKNIAELLNTDTTIAVGDVADGSVTTAKLAASAVTTAKIADTVNLGRRNLIINGAMQVAQRGTVTGATSGTYGGPDRFAINEGSDLVVTLSQDTDAPTGSGFSNSMKIDVTTADSSLAAGDLAYLGHKFEGQDLQRLKKGTSSAESVTLSFWIKTSVTGTYILQIYDNDNNRHISKSYTVSSADTWEHKSITFAGDTTGTLDDDNAYSLQLYWWLAAGSTYTSGTLATSWASFTGANAAVGQVNAINSTSNNIYITGVQLEVGDTATPFEHRSYGEELSLCQRYFFNILGGSTSQFPVNFGNAVSTGNNGHIAFNVPLPQPMRADPTFTHDLANSNYQAVNPGATQWSFYYQNQGWAGKAGNGDLNTLSRAMNGKSSVTLGTYYISPGGTTSDQLYVGGSRKMWLSAEL